MVIGDHAGIDESAGLVICDSLYIWYSIWYSIW